MANLGWTAFYGLLAVAPLMLAHEVMHGFGGTLFGHGSVINMNAANPQGLESTAQWVIFALSGTIYLFYLTLVLLLAFRKWHKLYLLVVALVAGTVHQVGFFLDLIRIMKHGSLGDSNRSDAFHAGTILWNNGPLIGCKLPWWEITFASGWPSLLIFMVLTITMATWFLLSWELVGVLPSLNRQNRFLMALAALFVMFFGAASVHHFYSLLASLIHASTDWEWSGSSTTILVLGLVLIGIPIFIWVRGGLSVRSYSWR